MTPRSYLGHRPGRLLAYTLAVALMGFAATSSAQPVLSIVDITWDIMGLDSNDVTDGPDTFPVAVRVTNTGDRDAIDVTASIFWDETPSPNYAVFQGLTSFSRPVIPPGGFGEYYFFVRILRDSNAYNFTREYHVEATGTDSLTLLPLPVISTPQPRQIFAERLISQNRNEVEGAFFLPDNLLLGRQYEFIVNTSTATQGYNQFESFIIWDNTILRIDEISAVYSADSVAGGISPNDTVYADACQWDDDPNSGGYNDCAPGNNDKAGGVVITNMKVTVVGVGTTDIGVVVHDFSGSSFHYNSDFPGTASTLSGTSATIGGLVFTDNNINQVFDVALLPGPDGDLGTDDDIPAEPLISGVTVELRDATGTIVLATSTTDSSGTYFFDFDLLGLLPGTYVVDVDDTTVPAGLALTTANDPTTVVIGPGDMVNDLDFGYVDPILLITLDSFTATTSGANAPIEIEWTTAAEVDNAGFQILSAMFDPINGVFIPGAPITSSLIPAEGNGTGASYQYIDNNGLSAESEIRAYFLVDIDYSGKQTVNGPALVTIEKSSTSALRGAPILTELLNVTFDDGTSSSDFTAELESNTGGAADYNLTYGFDYSTLTITAPGTAVDGQAIPEAPNTPAGAAATRGVASQVNLTGTGRKSISYFTNMDFTGDFEMQVDVFYFHDNNSGSTEDPIIGINHSGTFPIAWQTISAALTDQTDGYFFKTFGDIDIAGNDHYFFEGQNGQLATGAGALPGITWGDGLEADNPGRDAAGNAFFDAFTGYAAGSTTPGGAFRWVWQEVRIRHLNGIVTLYVNDTLIATYNDPDDTFSMGKVMLGHEDAFAGPNTGNYMIFDNLIVSELTAPPAAADWTHYE